MKKIINAAGHCQAFAEKMSEEGFHLPSLPIDDGQVHRFATPTDKKGKKSGWYVLHTHPYPFGTFGCHRQGPPWYQWSQQQDKPLSREAIENNQRAMAVLHNHQKKRELQTQQQAALKCLHLWNSAAPVSSHAYLKNKEVLSYGLRQIAGDLLIPVHDEHYQLTSLQRISSSHNDQAMHFHKRFFPGGKTAGCFYLIGKPVTKLYIAEGYATAATIHRITGLPVCIAFSCHNMKSVAISMRRLYPTIMLFIAADNDRFTKGNPGLTQGKLAAKASGATLFCPTFPPDSKGTDFNDLARINKKMHH